VVEQGTHKPLVGGSNPPSATNVQTRSPMTPKHSRTLGPKIAADYRLLNYLRAHATGSVDDIAPGSAIVAVEGGVLASQCEDDHEEVLECWAFYRPAQKTN
jgi:hypothetical protein